MDAGAAPARAGTIGCRCAARQDGVPVLELRDVPRDQRRRFRGRAARAGPHARREPADARRRHPEEHEGRHGRVDPRPAAFQAGYGHARDAAVATGPRRRRRLSGRTQMNRGPLGEEPARGNGAPQLKDGALDDARVRAALDATWDDPPGLYGWICSINHKHIARRFIVTCLVFFALAGLMAAVMRLQLSRPKNDIMGPDMYIQLFTMHSTTMMYLFAVPMMQAVATYLLPLMLGARRAAGP